MHPHVASTEEPTTGRVGVTLATRFVIPLLSMCPIPRPLPRMRDGQHNHCVRPVQVIDDLKREAVKHIPAHTAVVSRPTLRRPADLLNRYIDFAGKESRGFLIAFSVPQIRFSYFLGCFLVKLQLGKATHLSLATCALPPMELGSRHQF